MCVSGYGVCLSGGRCREEKPAFSLLPHWTKASRRVADVPTCQGYPAQQVGRPGSRRVGPLRSQNLRQWEEGCVGKCLKHKGTQSPQPGHTRTNLGAKRGSALSLCICMMHNTFPRWEWAGWGGGHSRCGTHPPNTRFGKGGKGGCVRNREQRGRSNPLGTETPSPPAYGNKRP